MNRRIDLVQAAVAFVIVSAGSLLQFGNWLPRVFFGDDLTLYMAWEKGEFVSTYSQMIFWQGWEKYRPVFQTMIGLLFRRFDDHYLAYVMASFVVHIVCAVAVFALAYRLAGRFGLALCVAIALATLRFAYFDFTLFGPVESLSLLFFLCSLWSSLNLFDPSKPVRPVTDAILLVAFAALAMFTHERYLALTPWLVLVIIWSPWLDSKKLVLSLVACVPAAANLLYKHFILNVRVAVGTAGQGLTFNFPDAVSHLSQTALSIIGINTGPVYLVGHPITSLRDPALWAAAVFIVGGAIVVFLGIRAALRTAKYSLRWAILASLVAGTLVTPVLLTVRVEQRWLTASAAIILLLLCWAVGAADAARRSLVSGIACLSLLAFVVNNTIISRDFSGMYLLFSSEIAGAMEDSLGRVPTDGPIDILSDNSICGWVLGNGDFFTIYTGQKRGVKCYASQAAWSSEPAKGKSLLVYDPKSKSFTVAETVPTPQPDEKDVAALDTKIVAFGPSPVLHAQPFNLQPNGESAIWVKLDRPAAQDFFLVLEGSRLATFVSGDVLTAAVPSKLFSNPGSLQLLVEAVRNARKAQSKPVSFEVQ
jgi:hypothetical protein